MTHFTAPGGIKVQLYEPRYTKGTSRAKPAPKAKRSAKKAAKPSRPAAKRAKAKAKARR